MPLETASFIGIDYGSKLAGTTVICFEKNNQLHFLQSEKKKDADAFLIKNIHELNPEKIFIDAPLSLPGVYSNNGDDFFYRQCDRAVNAMSPMFLGGLTARAMKLRAGFSHLHFYEIYPAHLVRVLFLENKFYKKDLAAFSELLKIELAIVFFQPPDNWHQVDAALAWLSGWRFEKQKAIIFGDKKEGFICV
jgi:predicted nuclease with RNAse H fold